jgi:multisubunit Na+/H+ antiporter MnhG subunit
MIAFSICFVVLWFIAAEHSASFQSTEALWIAFLTTPILAYFLLR